MSWTYLAFKATVDGFELEFVSGIQVCDSFRISRFKAPPAANLFLLTTKMNSSLVQTLLQSVVITHSTHENRKSISSYSLFIHPAFVTATDQLSVQQHPNWRAFFNCLINKVKFCLWADERVGGMGQWGPGAGVSEGGNSSLYQFVNKDKILHLMEWNAFKPSLEAFQVKRSSYSSKSVTALLFSFWSFNPGAGLPTDKKKTGPSPGDVEAIKVNMSGEKWTNISCLLFRCVSV